MKQTGNFQLSQWEMEDRIQMEDFNADNAKIDAALVKCGNSGVEMGSYVGTGAYGENSPNHLTFDRYPLAVMVAGVDRQMLIIRPCDITNSWYGEDEKVIYANWQDHTLTWYSPNNAMQQLNKADTTYEYYVLFDAAQ